MSKKEKCNPKKCKICGKPTCMVYNIGLKPVPICPRCGWLITVQTVDYAIEEGIIRLEEEEDRKLQEGEKDEP